MHVLLSMAAAHQDVRLEQAESRFNMAKRVHDQLERELRMSAVLQEEDDGDYMRTFFDPQDMREEAKEPCGKDEEAKDGGAKDAGDMDWGALDAGEEKAGEEDQITRNLRLNPVVDLCSVDFTVYAYLKEELVNTPNSEEVAYLKDHCPKLMKFYHFMDRMFGGEEESAAGEKAKAEDEKM